MNDMLPTGVLNWLRQTAPPAISGAGGHDATYSVACSLWRMLDDESAVWAGLLEYNATRCQPAWSEKELRHKMSDAEKATRGERGADGSRRRRVATLAEMRRVLATRPAGGLPLVASPAPVADAFRDVSEMPVASPAPAADAFRNDSETPVASPLDRRCWPGIAPHCRRCHRRGSGTGSASRQSCPPPMLPAWAT
jgi:hypothetical protein